MKTLSRTVGQNRVIDELVVSFTHDREMRVFLPGVAPTGRKVVLPHVVVMGFDEAGRVAYEHSIGIRRRSWCRSGSSTRPCFRWQVPNKPSGCWTRRNLPTK